MTTFESLDELRLLCTVTDRGCWEWNGGQYDGYGTIKIDGKARAAHRVAYELATGNTIPDGMLACHKCDNPPCCNPEHIFIGTAKDNAQDAATKGRMPGRKPTLAVPFEDILRCRIPSELSERFKKIAARKYRNVSYELRDIIRAHVEAEEAKERTP